MARANQQWKYLASGYEVLCVFHGPHAYISPSWYELQHTVPTWNYAVVHIYARPSLVDEAELKQIVLDTTAKYESSMLHRHRASRRSSSSAKIARGKDQEKMLRNLQAAPDDDSLALAKFILPQRERN
jgi:predicted FMN-binding regulatory protein PaiB